MRWLLAILLLVAFIPTVYAEETRFEFLDLDIPATAIVGEEFRLSGTLVVSGSTVDKVYLMIDGSNQLLIKGNKVLDLGMSFSSKTYKSFAFDILPLRIGIVEITLTAIAINEDEEVARKSITINLSSIEDTTNLVFKDISLKSDNISKSIYLTTTIENKGSFPAKDVIASIKAPGSMISVEDTIKYIEMIDINSNASITWTLQASESDLVDVEINVFASNSDKISLVVPINSFIVGNSIYFTNVVIPQNITVNKEFDVEFTLINNDIKPIEDILISIEVPEGLNIVDNVTINIESLDSDSEYSSKFRLVALESGTFSLRLRALSSNTSPVSIPLTITASDLDAKIAISSISTSPLYLHAGDTENILTIGITNYGDRSLNGVTMKLLLPDGFTPSWSGSDIFTFPFLPSNKDSPNEQFATFRINIDPDIESGSHTLRLLAEYDGEESIIDFNIFVMPSARFVFNDISFIKEGIFNPESADTIYADSTTTVRVKLKNVGDIAADSVVVQLQSSNDFQGVKSEVSGDVGDIDRVGTILPNEEFHATFYITTDPTIEEGIYPLTLLISWEQKGSSKSFSQTLQIPVKVSSEPLSDNLPYTTIFLAGISSAFLLLYIYSKRKNSS